MRRAFVWSCRSAGWDCPSSIGGRWRRWRRATTCTSSATAGAAHALKATLFAKREFAGFWEYLLDTALFTTPPHPEWSGAALLDEDGRLVGIGSLLLQENTGDETVDGNMFVPIDLLEPILDDLVRTGRSAEPPRPWLGIYAADREGHLVVNGLAAGGPGERAGVQPGDFVVAVGGERVANLADFSAGSGALARRAPRFR